MYYVNRENGYSFVTNLLPKAIGNDTIIRKKFLN